MKVLAAVVIPLHREEMSGFEQISFLQCLRVLGNHPVYIVAPPALNLENYLVHNRSIQVVRSGKLGSISGYNRLMLSPCFYRKFLNYKFILIYHLDAFVFEDQLNYWCGRDFDYIGPPWVDVDWMRENQRRFRVGNGGFAIKKPKTFFWNSLFFLPRSLLWRHNEDIFWSCVVPKYNPWFRIPRFRTALRFGFESSPRRCFKLNRQKLPFGNHGWYKYELDFWEPHIRKFGYSLGKGS